MPSQRPALAWFAGSLILYIVSAAQVPMWADSAKLTLYALHSYFPSLSPGDHPGWTVVAHVWLALLPGADPVRSLHLLSAFAGAAAVALVFIVIRGRGGDVATAHSAAAALMVMHSHWWSAAVTESYALATALTLLSALAAQHDMRKDAAFVAGTAAGLAAATHALSIFLTAPLLLPHRRQRWLFVVAGVLLGLAPVWMALVASPADPLTGHHPSRVGSWLWHVAAFVNPARVVGGLGRLLLLVSFGLGPLAVIGVAARLRLHAATVPRPRQHATLAALAVLLLILAGYSPARLHLMVGFLAVGVVLAFPPHLPRWGVIAHVALQVGLYTAVPAVLTAAGRDGLGVRQLPHRNNAWYFLCPVKALDSGPAEYARALLTSAPPNAVVVADFNPGALLMVFQEVAAAREDVAVFPTVIDELQVSRDPASTLFDRVSALSAEGRPVLLADSWEPYYRLAELERRFPVTAEPCGPGFLVRSTQLPGSSTVPSPVGVAVQPSGSPTVIR